MFAIVLIGSTTMSMALSPFAHKRGTAGGLFTSFELFISFVSGVLASTFSHPAHFHTQGAMH